MPATRCAIRSGTRREQQRASRRPEWSSPPGLGLSELLATPNARDGAQQLQYQSVVPMESSIPLGLTCDAWRRWRSARLRRRQLPGARLLAAGLRILALGAQRCRHFHESTTRYDHDQKLLSFLLVCRVCGIEKLSLGSRTNPASSLIPPVGSRREAIGFAGQQQPNAPIRPGPGGSRSWAVRQPARGGNGCRAW
jgi:hypothetical protein